MLNTLYKTSKIDYLLFLPNNAIQHNILIDEYSKINTNQIIDEGVEIDREEIN